MRHLCIPAGFMLALLSACATQSSMKPVEYLDDRTAMTVGTLKQPIELVPGLHQQGGSLHVLGSLLGKKVSFAYLGPVEWDRSGAIAYGLWIHIAPGNDRPITDIRSPKALTLILDGGTRELNPIDAPQLGRGAYEAVASWGQTAYFELTVQMLRQMAASEKLELNVRAADDSIVNFVASGDTREPLTAYLHSRGITDD